MDRVKSRSEPMELLDRLQNNAASRTEEEQTESSAYFERVEVVLQEMIYFYARRAWKSYYAASGESSEAGLLNMRISPRSGSERGKSSFSKKS